MKKLIAFCLVALLLLSSVVMTVSALTFPDLSESHWAYQDIQALVADGTINGFEDGTFRPGGTVTRAQFVKMLGVGPTVRNNPYTDVPSEHWAYTYIMSSGMPEDESNAFLPDVAITRGLVVELLWNRYKTTTDVFVPSLITNQYSKNPEAIRWAYATGLVQGDDGVSLRLDSTLTRAEAAVLIIRSRSERKNVAFADVIKPAILENVYNGLQLFDNIAYEPNRTITNGEMARAVLRIGSEETNLTYGGYTVTPDFEHPYAKDLSQVCPLALSKDRLTLSYANADATFGDAIAALTYNFIAKSSESRYGETTQGLPASVSPIMNVCLTYAKNIGVISLKEDLNKPITLKEFTIACLLFDQTLGSQTDYSTKQGAINSYQKINHSLLLTEQNYGDFRVMLHNMPTEIYTTPFITKSSAPKAEYDFAREYYSVFFNMLQFLKSTVKSKATTTVDFVYYPSLVWNNGNGYTMRVACDITEMNGSKLLSDIFPIKSGMKGADTQIKEGDRVYMDIATGEPLTSIAITDEKAYIEQLILVK